MKLLKTLFIFLAIGLIPNFAFTMQEDDNPASELSEKTVHFSIGAGGTQHRMQTSSTPHIGSALQGFPQFWYESSNLEEIKQALDQGADVNEGWPRVPLINAVQSGNIPLAKLLIEKGANPRLIGMSGISALRLLGPESHTLELQEAHEALPKMRRLFADYFLSNPETDQSIRTELERIITSFPTALTSEILKLPQLPHQLLYRQP